MTISTPELHEAHRALIPHVKSLRTTADLVGSVSRDQLRSRCQDALDFLVFQLIPRLRLEGEVLFPEIDRALGSTALTSVMRRDHYEVHQLTNEVLEVNEHLIGKEIFTDDLERRLRRALYGLFTVLEVHFQKQEELLLPILQDHLPAQRLESLLVQLATSGR